MSLSFVLRWFSHGSGVARFLPALQLPGGLQQAECHKFHSICGNRTSIGPNLLDASPAIPSVKLVCGMKTKGILHLRCKDCYFVWRHGRKFVMCKSMGRHKQQAMVKDEKNTWILTSASQGKRRAW